MTKQNDLVTINDDANNVQMYTERVKLLCETILNGFDSVTDNSNKLPDTATLIFAYTELLKAKTLTEMLLDESIKIYDTAEEIIKLSA